MPLHAPTVDPTPIFELFRGNYATELLVAATAHFRLFDRLADGPLAPDVLRGQLHLEVRPFVVLTTALRAMRLLDVDAQHRLRLTAISREHLVRSSPLDVSDYLSLAAETPAVQGMLERLVTNLPAGQKPGEQGVGFIYRENLPSAMEQEATARQFTLALAGRAKNVAPALAERAGLENARLLLDVAGGTGIYSIAALQRYPRLRAIIWDRPEVLKIAREMATNYGVAHRIELVAGDMFVDPVPTGADAMLLSNVLHDWDVVECQLLLTRCAAALQLGGRLLVHDVFLNDELDGPLPIALYSAALFCVTQGRAYSAAECRLWLSAAGLTPQAVVPTLIHCGLLAGSKPSGVG